MKLHPDMERHLYPWQREGWRILGVALWFAFFAPRHKRKPIRVLLEWARQTGKNELAALWDACFLVTGAGAVNAGLVDLKPKPGDIAPLWEAVHAAPTWKPGITVHKRRLESYLNSQQGLDWCKGDGVSYRAGDGWPCALNVASAGEGAQRRSLTASAYLRLDEVQLISHEVYNRELSPMCSSTGACQFAQGTVWTEDSLGHKLRGELEREQAKDGIVRVMRVDWRQVAEVNPAYRLHCEGVIALLGGEDHPYFQGEYGLVPPEGKGAFLRPADRDKLVGRHLVQTRPLANAVYVAGVDFCGADEEPDETAFDPDWVSERDNTCVRVHQLGWRRVKRLIEVAPNIFEEGEGEEMAPEVQVVATLLLPGQQPEEVVDKIEEFLRWWRVRAVVGDGRGVGDGPCAMLARRFNGTTTVRPNQTWRTLKSSAQDVKRMGMRLLGAIKSDRFKMWRDPECENGQHDSAKVWRATMLQYRHLRKAAVQGGGWRWGHPERRVQGVGMVHDDIPKADGYALEAGYDHLARTKPARELPAAPYNDAAVSV